MVLDRPLVRWRIHEAHFWATHGGAELDLVITRGGNQYGFECKLGDAPGTTRSMRVALDDLALEHLWVVYPGAEATHRLGRRRHRVRDVIHTIQTPALTQSRNAPL